MGNFEGFLDYLKKMPIPAIFCYKELIENREIFKIKCVNYSLLNIIENNIINEDVDFSELFNLNKQPLNISTKNSSKGNKVYRYISELGKWFCIEKQEFSESETIFYLTEITFNCELLKDGFESSDDFYYFISDNIEKFLEYINTIDKNADRYKDTMELFLTFINEMDMLREDLEEGMYLNKMSDFTNIVHELITPINMIYSSLQVIEKTGENFLDDNQAIRRNVNIMKLNAIRVIKLVDNIIDFTKLRTGYNDFNPETNDIVKFIEITCLSVVEFASEKNIELIFESDIGELFISFDKDKMERILINLLSNSIKYNKESNGIIKIRLSAQNGYFHIAVEDNGIGIPKEKIDKIFDRFEKVNIGGLCKPRGSGIGLSLVKSMVNMHGGKICLKSKVDVGTEFIVSLPIS